MVSISKGEVERKLRLCSGRVISGGMVACVSSSSVCATKNIHQGCFIIFFGVNNIVFI